MCLLSRLIRTPRRQMIDEPPCEQLYNNSLHVRSLGITQALCVKAAVTHTKSVRGWTRPKTDFSPQCCTRSRFMLHQFRRACRKLGQILTPSSITAHWPRNSRAIPVDHATLAKEARRRAKPSRKSTSRQYAIATSGGTVSSITCSWKTYQGRSVESTSRLRELAKNGV